MNNSNPTIYDVAELAGVSIGTVSNFFNRPGIVAPRTQLRIQKAIEALNFVPHPGATLLTGKTARMIGLVLLDIANPFFLDVARGAEQAAQQQGHLVTLSNSNGDLERELNYLKSLLGHRVAGVLLSPVDENSAALKQIRDQGLPIVLVGRGSKHYCSVVADNKSGGGLVGDHLAELGHREVAFVTGRLTATQYRLRREGLRKALQARFGKRAHIDTYESAGTGTIEEGRAAAKAMLEARRRPNAISCGNDLLAFGVFTGLQRAGVRIPQDVSLVGYDDSELAEFWDLTTVRQPKLEMGQKSAELLFQEIKEGGDHLHKHLLLKPSLVVRGSTASKAQPAKID